MKCILSTDYFDLYQISENAYGAIKTNDLCMSNAGFINLGDKIVVFDTFLSVDAAKELKQVVKDVTGNDNVIIINSHSHMDHFLGNCVFPRNAPIISSRTVFEKIDGYRKTTKFGNDLYTEDIKKLEKKLEWLGDRDEILNTKNDLIIYRNFNNDESKIISPNITFSKSLAIHGTSDSLELTAIEKAHSQGDVMCISQKEKMAFVGDLLFINQHPYLGQGEPIQLKKELYQLINSDIKYFIPGHGPICEKDKIIEGIEYLDSIMSLVQENLEHANKLQMEDLPSKFHHYEGASFRWNIDFLTEYFGRNKK